MKKLNRKGFTLVELLAVIIILAIVVGITIPAVLTTISNARKSAFNSAATELANWVDRQYQAALVGDDSIVKVDPQFSALCYKNNSLSCSSAQNLTANFIVAGGLKSSNFKIGSGSKVLINASTGRSCIKLTSVDASANGDYPPNTVACGGVCTDSQCKPS